MSTSQLDAALDKSHAQMYYCATNMIHIAIAMSISNATTRISQPTFTEEV